MLKLKTDVNNELNERICIDLPDKLLYVADRDLVKEDGSIFFSREEIAELGDLLERESAGLLVSGWRLPTLVELKFISAFIEYDEGVSDSLTGEDYLTLLGNDGYAGKELISGSIRTPIIETATHYWSDLSVAGGAMKISPNGASFELDHPTEASEQYGGFYDHPDSDFGYCVRLVRDLI